VLEPVLGPLVLGPLVLDPLVVGPLLVPGPAPEAGPFEGASLPQPSPRAAIVTEQIRNSLVRIFGPFGCGWGQPMDRLPLP
jgi:hypothetical protein